MYTDVSQVVTSSLNESLTLLLGNDSVVNTPSSRKTSPTDEYFRYLINFVLCDKIISCSNRHRES